MEFKLDLDAIRADIENMSKKTFSGYKVRMGQQLIRILPPYDASGIFYISSPMHWKIGGKSFPCERIYDSVCPACEAATLLFANGFPKEKAKLFFARSGCLFNIFDLSLNVPHNERGPFVARFSKTISSSILSFIADPSYAGMLDPANGRNINIIRQNANGINPPDQVYPAPNTTPIPPELMSHMADLPNLVKSVKRMSTDDISAAVSAHIEGSALVSKASPQMPSQQMSSSQMSSPQTIVPQIPVVPQQTPQQFFSAPIQGSSQIHAQPSIQASVPVTASPQQQIDHAEAIRSKLNQFLSNIKVSGG